MRVTLFHFEFDIGVEQVLEEPAIGQGAGGVQIDAVLRVRVDLGDAGRGFLDPGAVDVTGVHFAEKLRIHNVLDIAPAAVLELLEHRE